MANEYNKKQAIFEYLKQLNKDGGGKLKASLSAAQIVFFDDGIWKAQRIQYLANYWLIHNTLLILCQGKHQKTIRLIDDEDIAEKCHSWIRDQNYKSTPTAFKKFIENKLFPSIGIAKEKSISLMTATRCK